MPGQLELEIYGRKYNVDWGADTPPSDADIEDISQTIIREQGLKPPAASKPNPFSAGNQPSAAGAGAMLGSNSGKVADYYKGLEGFSAYHGFKTAPNPTGYRGKNGQGQDVYGGHNANSAHYAGRAVDVSVQGKSDQEIQAFIQEAQRQGIKVRDERTKPAGQEVWTGPHLHLSVDDGTVGEKLKSGAFKNILNTSRGKDKPNGQKITTPQQFADAVGANQPRQITPPQSSTLTPPPSPELNQLIEQNFGQQALDTTRAQRIARDSMSPEQRLNTEGTLEWAMKLVDQAAPKLAPEQRKTVKHFLNTVGGTNFIRPEAVHYAIQQLAKGDYMSLVDSQNIVTHLPFNTNELLAAIGAKEKVVAKATGEGYFTIKQAREMLARAVGIPLQQLTNQRIARLVRDSQQENPVRWAPGEREASINPMDELYARATGALDEQGRYRDVSSGEMLVRGPGAAFGLLPQIAQDAAGQVMGLDRGFAATNPDVQNSEVGKAGATVYGLAKYFTPGAGAAVAADAGYVLGRANEVGLKQATGELVGGILESSNPLAKDLSVTERVVRGVNAVLLGLGLTKGGVDAWNAGRRWDAARELGDKLGVGRNKAYNLLKEAESQAREYVRVQDLLRRKVRGADAQNAAEAISRNLSGRTQKPGLPLSVARTVDGGVQVVLHSKDGQQQPVGGARVVGDQLVVDYLNLPEDMRGRGNGTELITRLNEYAANLGLDLRVEHATPEVQWLVDALRRRGKDVETAPTHTVTEDGDIVPGPVQSTVYNHPQFADTVSARQDRVSGFKSTARTPYPSAETGQVLDDLAAVLNEDKPAAMFPANAQGAGPYLAAARKMGLVVDTVTDLQGRQQIVVGRESNVRALQAAYEHEAQRLADNKAAAAGGPPAGDNIVDKIVNMQNRVRTPGPSKAFKNAVRDALGWHPATRDSANTWATLELDPEGTGADDKIVVRVYADGTPTVLHARALGTGIRFYSEGNAHPVGTEQVAEGIRKLIGAADAEYTGFDTGDTLTSTEYHAFRQLEREGYEFTWNPTARRTQSGDWETGTGTRVVGEQQPLVKYEGRSHPDAQWTVEGGDVDPWGNEHLTVVRKTPGAESITTAATVNDGRLYTVYDPELSTTANVQAYKALAEYAKRNGLQMTSGSLDSVDGHWDRMAWSKLAEDQGYRVRETSDYNPVTNQHDSSLELDMNTVPGERDVRDYSHMSPAVRDWLDTAGEWVDDAQRWVHAAQIVDHANLDGYAKQAVLDHVSYYGIRNGDEIGKVVRVAEKIWESEDLTPEIKADLLDYLDQNTTMHPKEVGIWLREAEKQMRAGAKRPDFLDEPGALGMRETPLRGPGTNHELWNSTVVGKMLADRQQSVDAYRARGVKPNEHGTVEEQTLARELRDIQELTQERDKLLEQEAAGRETGAVGSQIDAQAADGAQGPDNGGGGVQGPENAQNPNPQPQPPDTGPNLPKGYGKKNKRVTRSDVHEAWRRMMGNGPMMNFSRETLDWILKIAQYHVEAATHTLADFVRVVGHELKDAPREVQDWFSTHAEAVFRASHEAVNKKWKRPADGNYSRADVNRFLKSNGLPELPELDPDIVELFKSQGLDPKAAPLDRAGREHLTKVVAGQLRDKFGELATRRSEAAVKGDSQALDTVNEELRTTVRALESLQRYAAPGLDEAGARSAAFRDLLSAESNKPTVSPVRLREVFEAFSGSLDKTLALKVEGLSEKLADVSRRVQDFEQRVAAGEQFIQQDFEAGRALKVEQGELKGALDKLLVKNDEQTGLDLLNSMWKAGLIFTVKNFVQNFKGNTLNSLALTLSRMPRGWFDAGYGRLTGIRTREASPLGLKNARAMYKQTLTRDLVGDMWGLLKGEQATYDKYNFRPAKTTNNAQNPVYKPIKGAALSMGDRLVNVAFGYVNSIDKPFYELAYNRSLIEQARLKAKSEGLKSGAAEFDRRVGEILSDPLDSMKLEAVMDAEYAIYANKNKIADFLNRVRREMKNNESFTARVAGRGLDWLIPFANIPTNVALRTFEFSPLGLGDALVKAGKLRTKVGERAAEMALDQSTNLVVPQGAGRTEMAGAAFQALTRQEREQLVKMAWKDIKPQEQKKVVDALGNGLTGTMLLALGYMAYRSGYQHEYTPDTPEGYAQDEARARISGAAVVGGHSVDLSAGFLGRVLAMGATVGALLDGKYANAEGEQGAKEVSNTLGTIIGQAFQNPVVEGGSTIDKILKNPVVEGMRAVQGIGSSVVPGIVNEASRLGSGSKVPVTDKFEAGGWLDTVSSAGRDILSKNLAKVPVVRGGMDSRTDVMGRKLNQSMLENVLGMRQENTNPVVEEIINLGLTLSKPQRAKKDDRKWGDPERGVRDKRFDRTEADYQDRVAYVGFKVNEYLTQYLNSEEYRSLGERDRRENLRKMLSELKSGFNQEFDAYRWQNGYDESHRMVRKLIGDE